MKRLVIVAVAALALIAGTASTAHASTTWPAACRTMRCVNHHLNSLDVRQRSASAKIVTLTSEIQTLTNTITTLQNTASHQASLLNCIVPMTAWQQYTYDFYGNFFTYLDRSRSYGSGTENGPYTLLTDNCGIF